MFRVVLQPEKRFKERWEERIVLRAAIELPKLEGKINYSQREPQHLLKGEGSPARAGC